MRHPLIWGFLHIFFYHFKIFYNCILFYGKYCRIWKVLLVCRIWKPKKSWGFFYILENDVLSSSFISQSSGPYTTFKRNRELSINRSCGNSAIIICFVTWQIDWYYVAMNYEINEEIGSFGRLRKRKRYCIITSKKHLNNLHVYNLLRLC